MNFGYLYRITKGRLKLNLLKFQTAFCWNKLIGV